MSTLRGRCLSIDSTSSSGPYRLRIQTEAGVSEAEVRSAPGVRAGDLVGIEEGAARVLTPNRASGRTTHWMERVLDARRLRALQIRTKVEDGIREHFRAQGFHEVRTPLLVPCPGMEPHIRPMKLEGGAYLPTSPEFAMKRLLVGGLEKIFQLCPAFRLEPYSHTHHPEFTMLEWYRAYAGYGDIMRDTEELFAGIATRISGRPVIQYQGREISLETPWPRLRVRDLFQEKVGVDLVASSSLQAMRGECQRLGLEYQESDTWDDLYFRIWLNLIEPALPQDRAVLVMRYPASQAALSVKDTDPDGSLWARRFEFYIAGLELGNAFEELTDPVEQRARFVEDMELRERLYGSAFPKNPLDEEFLQALEEGMPPSGGIAVGVDRMVMLFADEPEIDRTLWLGSYSPLSES
jgi:lysyl-tRNA synthetase class 2